MVGKEGATAGH
uniref:Uncharacterized protein n=1 Tax=Arundo donax TaxID=35708 RepID=A0A0A9HD54_ARUDO